LQQLRLTHSVQLFHLHFRSKVINLHVSSFKIVAGTAAEESVRALTHYPTHATLKELHIDNVEVAATLEALLCSDAARSRLSSVVKLCLEVCNKEGSRKKHNWSGVLLDVWMTFVV